MPDVNLPKFKDGYPEDAEVHVRRAVESAPAALRAAAQGDVAQRGVGLPGDDPAPGRAWHGVDRHRRGNPRLLDPRPGPPRQPGLRPQPGASVPALEGRRGRARAGDGLPRPRPLRPDRLPLPAEPRPGRRGRLPRQAPRHRQRLPAQPRHARPRDPRRRELLGILPRRRRLVPAVALSGRRRGRRNPARHRRRVPPRPPAHRARSAASSPEAGSATTSPSGSATTRTTAPGTRSTRPATSSSARPRPAATTPRPSPEPGTNFTSPKGSDWFWWYGDDHSSALDALFDHLFRKHLRNVFTLLGQDPPSLLFDPISQAAPHRPLHEQPSSFLNVKVDGRTSYFEWINAARYVCGNDRGTMTLVSQGLMKQVHFGFDENRLLHPRRCRGWRRPRAPGRGGSAPHRVRRSGRVGGRRR